MRKSWFVYGATFFERIKLPEIERHRSVRVAQVHLADLKPFVRIGIALEAVHGRAAIGDHLHRQHALQFISRLDAPQGANGAWARALISTGLKLLGS